MDNVWLANIVTSGVPLGLIAWLLNRSIKKNDETIKSAKDDAEQALEKSNEIEKNYIERFAEVNKTINDSVQKITGELTVSIREVEKDKTAYRINQIQTITEIKTKLEGLAMQCERFFRGGLAD